MLPAVSGAGSASVIYQPFTATAAPYVFSIWLKGAVGGEQVYLGAGGVSFIFRAASHAHDTMATIYLCHDDIDRRDLDHVILCGSA